MGSVKSLGQRRRRGGFTLIEVLIVVVIIGVLAALVIPRFISTPEKAIVAEANQMLGTLARAQGARVDTGAGFLAAAAPISSANWNALGLVIPASASKFTYSCASPTCQATRTIGSSLATAALNYTNNAWTCSNGYTTMSNGGCTLA